MTSDPGGDEGHRQLTGFWVRSFVVRQTGLTRSRWWGEGGAASAQTPDSVRAAGGRLMWLIPSHETELRLDTPDPVPMGTLWRRQEVTQSNVLWAFNLSLLINRSLSVFSYTSEDKQDPAAVFFFFNTLPPRSGASARTCNDYVSIKKMHCRVFPCVSAHFKINLSSNERRL